MQIRLAQRPNVFVLDDMLRHNEDVKEVQRQTITRRIDEPKLEIDDMVAIKDGVVGVVVARYTASGDERQDIHYIVELRPEERR